MKRINIILAVLVFILFACSTNSFASSLSISSSKSSVTTGDTFTVTISASDATGRVNLSASGNVSLSQSSIWIENNSAQVTVTANSAGTASITVTGNELSNSLGEEVNLGSKTTNVTVSDPAPVVEPEPEPEPPAQNTNTSSNNNSTPKPVVEKSSDSKLKALSVEGYTLSPEFSSSTKEYTLSVPYEVTSVDISASVNHNKATYSVSGDEELEVGENEVIVKGRAEDGSTTKYVIKVTRAREELYLTSIIAKITDENGVITELPLNPIFSFDILEYTLEEVSNKVEKIEIEALANLEGATIEITGNENLKEGENTITITAKIPKENIAEGEEETEEVKIYTIKVNKEAAPVIAPPTMMGTIKTFYDNNSGKIISGTLLGCSVALFGLTIYFIVDYKKYKTLIKKVAELSNLNNQELVTENNIEVKEDIKEAEKEKKVGRHF